MKRAFYMDLTAYFGPYLPDGDYPDIRPGLAMRHAHRRHYRRQADHALVQEFDGRYGYLYSYDLHVTASIRIACRVEMGDLHVLYLMAGSGDITLLDAAGQPITDLAPQRARYLYLPPGAYMLYLPQGSTHLFGFYFDGGIFRTGNERGYRFLQTVLTAYREQSESTAQSIDFDVGPRTQMHIEHLCSNLCKGHLNNELFIYNSIHKLIELSKEHVTDAHACSDAETLIRQARKSLQDAVALYGNGTRIRSIARMLHVTPAYLSRLHRRYYGQSLATYRNALLVEQLKSWLTQHDSVLYVSHISGFHGISAMNRFFKRHTGITPKHYRDHLLT